MSNDPNGNGFGSFGGARKPPPNVIARKSNGGPPAPPPDLGKVLSRPPWDQHKPPTAQDFWTFTPTLLVLPAGAGSTVSTSPAVGGAVTLGQDSLGVLQSVIFTIDAPTTAASIRFTVFANSSGIPGLSGVGFPPVNATTFALPINGVWQLGQGTNLSVTFTNLNASGPWSVGMVLSGYQILASDVFAYTGERLGMIETGNDDFKKNLAR